MALYVVCREFLRPGIKPVWQCQRLNRMMRGGFDVESSLAAGLGGFHATCDYQRMERRDAAAVKKLNTDKLQLIRRTPLPLPVSV